MLAELALRLLSGAHPDLRRVGLLREAVALWSRSHRRRTEWSDHERHCHAIVARAMADLPRTDTAVVLGSGLCRDIPIEKLSQRFRKVVLVDAVHLWPARVRLRHLTNLEFVTGDITGAVGWLLGRTNARQDALGPFRNDDSTDLVVSANLLSQLAICPEDWLERNPARAQEFPPDLPQQLIRCHLDDLARLTCRVCLLTDVVMRRVDRAGTVLEEMNLVADAPLGPPDDAWDWTVAPFGEISRDIARVHRVHGYADWRPVASQLPAAGPVCDEKGCAPPNSTS